MILISICFSYVSTDPAGYKTLSNHAYIIIYGHVSHFYEEWLDLVNTVVRSNDKHWFIEPFDLKYYSNLDFLIELGQCFFNFINVTIKYLLILNLLFHHMSTYHALYNSYRWQKLHMLSLSVIIGVRNTNQFLLFRLFYSCSLHVNSQQLCLLFGVPFSALLWCA